MLEPLKNTPDNEELNKIIAAVNDLDERLTKLEKARAAKPAKAR